MDTTSSTVGNTSDGISDVPGGCLALNSTVHIPWNSSDDVISIETRNVFQNVKCMIIGPILLVIGGPSNVLNMAVFAKHGLKHRINVCLFTLSFVDLLYGISHFSLNGEQLRSTSIYDHPYFGPVMQFITTYRLNGLLGLYFTSLFVSSVIALERCVCVLFPLRVKTLVSTRIMWVILSVGTLIIIVGFFWVGNKISVGCVYSEDTHVFILTIFASQYYLDNKYVIDTLDVVVYGLSLPVTAVTTVAIATLVTVIKLRKSITWREQGSSSLCSMSTKEIALTKMLVYLSVEFILLNLPNVFFRVASKLMPEISSAGRRYNLYFVLLGSMQIIAAMKTSFNIFIYFTMGSRYRETVYRMFRVSVMCFLSASEEETRTSRSIR